MAIRPDCPEEYEPALLPFRSSSAGGRILGLLAFDFLMGAGQRRGHLIASAVGLLMLSITLVYNVTVMLLHCVLICAQRMMLAAKGTSKPAAE